MKRVFFIIALITIANNYAQEYDFGKVSKAELEEKFYPLDSTAEAAYLFKYRRTYFDYDKNNGFQVVTDIHERIKIYTKEGYDYATQKIRYYKPESGSREKVSGLKAYTYNLIDNKIQKEKVSKKGIFDEKLNKYRSQKKISFPNIKEGTILEFKYKLTYPYYGIKDLEFQYGIPIKKILYKVEIPEYFLFNKKSKGYFIIPMKESVKTGKIDFGYNNLLTFTTKTFLFEYKDVPAMKDDEPFISNIHNYRGGVSFELSGTRFPNSMVKNYSTSWDKVSKQIYKSESFGGELNKSSYYQNELKKIIEEAKTDIEKASLIFNFVKNKVKWNGYYGKYTDKGVRRAYKEGVGNSADINLMLTSMLRSSGLNANPVLVSTRNNGVPIFPTLDGFNYVISAITLPEGYILLDATEVYSEPNTLPVRTLNWNGRLIKNDGTSYNIPLVPKRPSLESNNINIKISDEGIVDGLYRTNYTNHYALSFRKKNNHLKEEELISQLEEEFEIEIDKFKIKNSTVLGKPVNRVLMFSSEDLIEEINDKLYLEPLLFLTNRTNPFKLKERKFPVDFGTPLKIKNQVSIAIPEGYKIESIPESTAVSLPNNLGIFKYQVKETGKKIMVISVVQINSAIITPQYYKNLKEFYNILVQKQTEKIILIKE